MYETVSAVGTTRRTAVNGRTKENSVRARRSKVLRAPPPPPPLKRTPPPPAARDPHPLPRIRPKLRADVIDLGAPRSPADRRARRSYTPNPRLYPCPQARTRAGARPRRRHPPAARPTRLPLPPRRRLARRPALRAPPNARLYWPPPPRARTPPAPRAAWPPPAPVAPRALDTASHVALLLAARCDFAPATTQRRSPSLPPPPACSRRLVVTLPAAGDASARRTRPAPAGHPRLLSLDTDSGSTTSRSAPPRGGMAAPPRTSVSPEDRSDGNDPLSAPSEYLAEFLSAIMQRQYAEALKYCRLILQYEPHNATARGFYPLLRQKLGLARGHSSRASPRGSDSDDASRHSAAPPRDEEVMSHSADESVSEGSCASQSSLSLDSSERSASHSASAGSSCWPSDGASDEPDDNGNAPAPPTDTLAPRAPRPDDVENDNAGGGGGGGEHTARLKSESAASLRRLRAQFAREIK